MSLTRGVIRIIRDNSQMIFTPKLLQYEALKRDIPLSYENAKKILQRLYRRGFLNRISRGEYIFSPKGDKRNHSKGQKGTNLRGRNHFKENEENTSSTLKKGHFKGFFSKKSFPIRRQVFFIFWNNKRPFRIRDVYLLMEDTREDLNYRSIQSAINYFMNLGILGRKGRGTYFIKDWELAKSYVDYELEGTPLGGRNQREDLPNLITVSHHFRIKKPIPLTEEEFSIIARYLWSKDPIKDYVNGVYLEAYPTGEGDRSHGVKIITKGATFHITYSYKKNIAKVMIYPKGKESWGFYAERLFGKDFLERAVRIGISSHFALNLDEIKKVIYEGDEIKVTINKSDFGASGDLELEDVSPEGAEYFLKKIWGYAEEVDILESLSRKIDEVYTRIYYLEKATDTGTIKKLEEDIEILKGEIKDIKAHIIQHSRAFDLILKGMYPAPGELKGYG